MTSGKHFETFTNFRGICRDDGLAIFEGSLTPPQVNKWLVQFQESIDTVAGGTFFQFTANVWAEGLCTDVKKTGETLTTTSDSFPFLGMNLHWDEGGDLCFEVCNKPGQRIKHVGKDSTHTPATLATAPKEVLKRLARLTSNPPHLRHKMMDQIHPEHAAALRSASLINKFPTLQQALEQDEEDQAANEGKMKKKQGERNICPVAGFSRFWKTPAHKMATRLLKKHNMGWIRARAACKRFSNLGEKFDADLTHKLNKDLASLDFKDSPCNCNSRSKVAGRCAHGGRCRAKCIICKATCRKCKMFCAGGTQQPMKGRMGGHFTDARHLVKPPTKKNNNKNKSTATNSTADNSPKTKSDSFARHVATHFCPGAEATNQQLREMFSFEMLREGNPVSLNKSFGRHSCTLCVKERLKISEHSMAKKKTHSLSIIKNSETFGACRHKPRFHRFPSSRNANRNSVEARHVPGSSSTCSTSAVADRPPPCLHESPRQTSSTDDRQEAAKRASQASQPVLNVQVDNSVSFEPSISPLTVAGFCMPASPPVDVQTQHSKMKSFHFKSQAMN